MHLLARHSKSSRSRPRRNCSNPRCLARRTGCAMPESYRRPAAGLPRPFGNSSQNREAPAHWPAAPDDAPPIRPAPRRSGQRDPRSIKSKGESCTPTRIPNPPQDKRFFGFSMTRGIVLNGLVDVGHADRHGFGPADAAVGGLVLGEAGGGKSNQRAGNEKRKTAHVNLRGLKSASQDRE